MTIINSVPFASLKGASRIGVLLGILGAGCTTIPIQEPVGTLEKPAADGEVDSLPPPDIAMPPIEPVIPPQETK